MDPIAEVLRHTAEKINKAERDGTLEKNLQANTGGELFTQLFESARTLYGTPAIKAIEKHQKWSQLQHCPNMTPQEASELLQEIADSL